MQMFNNIKNKKFLVTGSSGFIGQTICKKIIEYGGKVIGTDLNEKKIKYGDFIKADLTLEKDRNNLFKYIDKKFKRVDVLINNAAYVGTSVFDKKSSNYHFDSNFTKLNLESTISVTEKAIPFLLKSKNSSIINISSIYGFLAFDKNLYKGTKIQSPVGYSVSKAGLIQYSKLLSSKLGPNIRVNTISPGGIWRGQDKKFLKRYISKTHLKKMGKEEDIANAVLFLSSNFSSYITGHNLVIDGGYSIS